MLSRTKDSRRIVYAGNPRLGPERYQRLGYWSSLLNWQSATTSGGHPPLLQDGGSYGPRKRIGNKSHHPQAAADE